MQVNATTMMNKSEKMEFCRSCMARQTETTVCVKAGTVV